MPDQLLGHRRVPLPRPPIPGTTIILLQRAREKDAAALRLGEAPVGGDGQVRHTAQHPLDGRHLGRAAEVRGLVVVGSGASVRSGQVKLATMWWRGCAGPIHSPQPNPSIHPSTSPLQCTLCRSTTYLCIPRGHRLVRRLHRAGRQNLLQALRHQRVLQLLPPHPAAPAFPAPAAFAPLGGERGRNRGWRRRCPTPSCCGRRGLEEDEGGWAAAPCVDEAADGAAAAAAAGRREDDEQQHAKGAGGGGRRGGRPGQGSS